MKMRDDFGLVPVEAEQCRGCLFRGAGIAIGEMIVSGHDKTYCDVYTPETGGKPAKVLAGLAECKHRRQEAIENH